MKLFQVINLARDYLILGVIGLIFMWFIYWIFLRKFLKNHVKSHIKKVVIFCILFCYIVIVSGATIFIRPGVYEHANLHLFSSYIEAWNNYSKSYWRNIVLNILMFVPFGFLLPLFSDKFKNFFATMSLSLMFTVGIEVTQYITKRGIFEVDDIMNNWIGALIGYSLVMFILLIFSKEKTRFKPLKLTLCILPIVLTLAITYKIIENYNNQEFGNLSSDYNYVYHMDDVTLSSDVELNSKDIKKQKVYISERYTKEETLQFAESFFKELNAKLDKSNIETYENQVVYNSKDKRYRLAVHLRGGTYDLDDFKSDKNKIYSNMDEESVKDILSSYNIEVYPNSQFEEQKDLDENDKSYIYKFSVDLEDKDNKLTDGYISVEQNDENLHINNYIYQYDVCGEYKIISEEEAYEKIKAGEFNSYELYDIQSIVVRSVKLCYQVDSKGFYQPVYRFECTIDGEGRPIFIPALAQNY